MRDSLAEVIEIGRLVDAFLGTEAQRVREHLFATSGHADHGDIG